MADASTILIVDDEPHILRSLGFVLARAGYRVLSARNGGEALEAIRQGPPDLVFLDIMIPEPDGYEVCRGIRSDPELAGVYVIMLTAKGQEADRRRGVEAGGDEYMTKPFSPSDALARVRRALGDSTQEP